MGAGELVDRQSLAERGRWPGISYNSATDPQQLFALNKNNQAIRVFATSSNSQTGLNATVVVEPNDVKAHSVWLYLSNADEIISDCLLANLAEPVDSRGRPKNRDAPPPALRQYLTSEVPSELPGKDDLHFTWSKTGKDVAVSVKRKVVGFILWGEKRGYSRALSQAGPWGNPWSDDLFNSHF